MKIKDFLTSLKDKWEGIVIIITLTTTFGLYINFFLPHYYSAKSQFLIAQKQNSRIDAYTAIKGAEQLAYTFKEIILSPVFFEAVSKSNFNIKTDYFSGHPEKTIKKWQKTVRVENLPNTGIFEISIFHPERKEALKISQASAYVITSEYQKFLGNNEDIKIISLSNPIVSEKFAKPNALLNTFTGLVIGVLASAGLVVVFPNKKISFSEKKELSATKKEKYKTEKTKKNNQPLIKKVGAPSNLPTI